MASTQTALIWLRKLPIAEAFALLDGCAEPTAGLSWHPDYPMTETQIALSMLFEAHRAAAWTGDRAPTWWLFQIVRGDEVVGDIGFHGPPASVGPVEVEIGYNVVPALRRRGLATQACRLMLAQSWRDGADVVRAETAPDNVASRRVLQRCGFAPESSLAETGDRHLFATTRPAPGGAEAR